MEDNQIIDKLISVLENDDMWFTQKTDPTFGEAPDYYKLDEYGDLTEAGAKKIIKEITAYIGDGAVDIDDAITIWLQDAMADNRVAYRDILVTKFKDKPVVDGIEAYKNPVQLSENKAKKIEAKKELGVQDIVNWIEKTGHIKMYNEYANKDENKGKPIPVLLYGFYDWVNSPEAPMVGDLDFLEDDEADKLNESIYDLDKNAEIKRGVCPYCGSKHLDYYDGAKEPRVVEYNDYVSYDWTCKDCGKEGQEIFSMEFIGHDLYRNDDDIDDSTTDFIGKTESKEIKSEDKHLVYVSQLQQDTLEKVMKMCDDGMSFVDVWFEMQEDGYDLKCYSRNHKKGSDMPTRGMLYKNNEFSFVTIINGKDGKCSWETEGPVYYDENKKVNFNNCTKDKKEENIKRRLKEENNKSANLISQMIQDKNFDADSNAGKIVLRTNELFNALSDKGYDVQVAFDNGESTNAVLLGEQGGQVIITITDSQQPLKAFASGNFEINTDNTDIMNNIANIVKAI